jgi:predicted Rossmann-fold nucleotide-binding protein
MSEILTLSQTRKLEGKMTVILYGKQYWNEIINFDALVKHGMIGKDDLNLFSFASTPAEALERSSGHRARAAGGHARLRQETVHLRTSYLYQRSGD